MDITRLRRQELSYLLTPQTIDFFDIRYKISYVSWQITQAQIKATSTTTTKTMTYTAVYRWIWLISVFSSAFVISQPNYEPNWASLDSRPLPTWYDDSKFGIMICIGLYSVPSFENEWFWQRWASNNRGYEDYMQKNYRPGFRYQDFAPMYKAELFDPDEWTDLFRAAGAKYELRLIAGNNILIKLC